MNSVVLIGRLCADPETRYISGSQTAVCSFTLAVDRLSSNEKTADFIRIKTFAKTAELVEKYVAKGRLVAVQGRIQTGSYKNKEGATVYTTDVIADRVEFLDKGEKAEFKPEDENQDPKIPEGFAALEDDDPF